MAKTENIVSEGTVTESSGKGNFKVELSNGNILNCTLSGKIRTNFVRIDPGDKVQLSISPYDLTRGIITYRLTSKSKS